MLIAKLVTKCGCEKLLSVQRFEREIYIPLLEPLSARMFDEAPSNPTMTVPIKRRIFEYRHRLAQNMAEYREVQTLNG